MKRIIALLLCIVSMCFCLTACSNSTATKEKESTATTKTQSATTTKQAGLTDSQIESATVEALIKLIKNKYKAADAGSCRYSINKVTQDRKGDYIVYGTVTLYDKYGKLTTGHHDGSGSYTRSFEIKINGEMGYAYAGGKIQ